uniref:AAA_23 domain-containing protein n=1 Tax=Ascaris lumbricoides TaxID=6252 RepID=A0A0M3I309_ASCLU
MEVPVKRRSSSNSDQRSKRARLSIIEKVAVDLVPEVPGRIVSLELENFMCHSHMKIEFDITNNNCFFIGGSNGSGKSAILAALNIGLGGQGSMNERGNSLQDYIKYGKKRAKITTMLSNKGYGRHEDFGEYLIVERILTPAGSTYQLISVEGSQRRFVNCRKRDLDSLLARFGIQLRNPIFWMSQDRCRVFLQEMKPERLYSVTSFNF